MISRCRVALPVGPFTSEKVAKAVSRSPFGSGIHNKELQAQHARRRLQVGNGGFGNRKRRVR